jgi:glucose-6-phosphate 1-epimerase
LTTIETAATVLASGFGGSFLVAGSSQVQNAVPGKAVTDLAALEARWGRAPGFGTGGVRFEQRYGGPVAVLEAAGSVAIVALQGAQVLSWQSPQSKEDVLWLSPVAKLGTGKAVRGGVPVCWPWFGPHPADAKKPAHGFVRAAHWRVAGSAASARRATLVLSFDAAMIDPTLWPSRASAELEITLAEALTISLSTTNLGDEPLALTQALHTYLAVGDIADISVSGFEDRTYIDQLDNHARRVQAGEISFQGEVDRIYQGAPGAVIVTDRNLGREIQVAKLGSQSTVVWNPWIEKAERLGDMGPEGYRRMLCIEAANAGDDVVTLAPNARHRLVTEISVKPIASI